MLWNGTVTIHRHILCYDCVIPMMWCSVIGRPQDHTGSLMAEEFKACLISLGYDVENNKQVGAPGGETRGGEPMLAQPLSRRTDFSTGQSLY